MKPLPAKRILPKGRLVPKGRSFLRKKRDGGGTPTKEQLSFLREELLMLAALRTGDDDQTGVNSVVSLCRSDSMDKEEFVGAPVAEVRGGPRRGGGGGGGRSLMDVHVDTLITAASQEADGFEVLSLDSDDEGDPFSWFYEAGAARGPTALPTAITEKSTARTMSSVATEAPSADVAPLDDIPLGDIHLDGANAADDYDDEGSVSTAGTTATAKRLASLTAGLVTSQAKLVTDKAKNKAAVAEKALEYKIAALKRKEEAVREKHERRMTELKAEEEAKRDAARKRKEEAINEREVVQRRKEEEKAEKEERRVEKEVRKSARKIVKEDEKRARREAKEDEKRERRERKKMELEVQRERKKEEARRALALLKQREVDVAKQLAVKDLQEALRRVELAQGVATKLEDDPEYDPDDAEKSVLTGKSRTSSKRSLTSLSSAKKRRGKKDFTGSLIGSESTDARDDITAISSRSQGVRLSDEVTNIRATLDKLQRQLRAADGREGSPDADALPSLPSKRTVSFEDEVREESERALASDDVGDQPDSLRAWLEWFMGDPERGGYCSGSSCGSSQEEEPEEKKYRGRFSRPSRRLIVT